MRWLFACAAVSAVLLLAFNPAEAGCRRPGRCQTVAPCATSVQCATSYQALHSVVIQSRTVQVTHQAPASVAPQLSAEQWADEIRRRGRLDHDAAYISRGGAEVLAFAPDQVTAWRIWKQSPPHAALLPQITHVTCRSGVCVGRRN